MTHDEMYDAVTEINGGRAMNETLFDQFANMVKNIIESKRPWVRLRKEDSSLTLTASDTFETAKTMPTDFSRWIQKNETRKRYPVRLVSGKTVLYLDEAPYERRHELQDSDGYYFVDYANSRIYFGGARSTTYTVYLTYIRKSPDIADGADWVFPSEYHMIIPLMVSGANKGGVDYDDIMARMAPDNRAVAESIMTAMCFWDADLQRSVAGV